MVKKEVQKSKKQNLNNGKLRDRYKINKDEKVCMQIDRQRKTERNFQLDIYAKQKRILKEREKMQCQNEIIIVIWLVKIFTTVTFK